LLGEVPVFVSTDITGPGNALFGQRHRRSVGKSECKASELWSEEIVDATTGATWKSYAVGLEWGSEGVEGIAELLVGDEAAAVEFSL
jgi:hypothetical protein